MKKSLQNYLKRYDVSQKLEFLKTRYFAFMQMFKKKYYSRPDDLFFAIEDLPLIGKEYWFLHFCSPGSKTQAIITFGRALDEVKVNKTNVDKTTKRIAGIKVGGVPCASVAWFYDSAHGKQVVLDCTVELSIDGSGKIKVLEAKKGNSHAKVFGAYPKYRVLLSKGGKTLFEANVSKPPKKTPYEIIRMFSQPLAPGLEAAMVNYYFEFDGKMHGKQIRGSAYLQKVVAAIPLAPWNWVRMHFKCGSVVDFFAGKPLGDELLKVACVAYLEHNGKRTRFDGLKLRSYGIGEARRWVLEGNGFMLAMKSYATQRFRMKTNTEFIYDEYLVTASDFVAKTKAGVVTSDEVGNGSGIVEEASGYLL